MPSYWTRLLTVRRQLIDDAFVGCSLVNLSFVGVWVLLFSARTANAFYLTVRPLHYVAALLIVVAGGALAAASGQLVRRSALPVQYVMRIAFLATLVILLNQLRKSAETSVTDLPGVVPMLRALGKPGIAVVALVVAALVVRFAFPLSRAYRVLLLLFFPFVVWTVGRACWTLATVDFAQFHESTRTTHTGVATPSRVVIVLLDELDYESVFLTRPKDLALPHFDALRMTTVSFDSVVTPGANTAESVSSFFLQKRVAWLETTGARSFIAHLTDGGTLQSDTATSFLMQPGVAEARIGIVGFALPYCRLAYTAVAERCDWMPVGGVVWPVGYEDSFQDVVMRQLQSLHPYDSRRFHIHQLERMLAESVRFASDSSLSLVFLHLALPHAPYIWDRNTNEFTDGKTSMDGYYDNLALADRFLGRLRDAMMRSGTWSASTVIVMSDHAERKKLRDKRSSDRRVPLFVKLPGMESGARVSNPVNTMFLASLMPDFLAKRVRNAADLRSRALDYMRIHPSLLRPPKD